MFGTIKAIVDRMASTGLYPRLDDRRVGLFAVCVGNWQHYKNKLKAILQEQESIIANGQRFPVVFKIWATEVKEKKKEKDWNLLIYHTGLFFEREKEVFYHTRESTWHYTGTINKPPPTKICRSHTPSYQTGQSTLNSKRLPYN